MGAEAFPQPKGLFDWLAEDYVSPFTGSKIRPTWRCDASRPVFLLAGARCLGSGTQQRVTERTMIVFDGNQSARDAVKGYCLPNLHIDASYVAGGYEGIDRDLKELQLSRDGNGVVLSNGEIPEVLRAFRLELNVTYKVPRTGVASGNPISAEIQSSRLVPLIRPRFAPCLPLPADKGEWRCISSRATWQALLSLTKSFGSARPPLVLVTGPPGSGKEAYARAVHFGHRKNPKGETLKTISLAELDASSLRNHLAKILPRLQRSKGTLFFDEVDKPSPEVRSSLLRVLEARTYSDVRGKECSCDEVTFVCAAGKQLSELRSLAPADFWTRMEIHVPVQDPLLAASQADREELLVSFFKFFWWDFASSWAESLLTRKNRDEGWSEYFAAHEKSRKLVDNLFEFAIGKWDDPNLRFATCKSIDKIATHLASVLSPHLERRQLSTRGLRSVVISVLAGARSQLLAAAVSDDKESMSSEFEMRAQEAIHDAIGTVLQVLPG